MIVSTCYVGVAALSAAYVLSFCFLLGGIALRWVGRCMGIPSLSCFAFSFPLTRSLTTLLSLLYDFPFSSAAASFCLFFLSLFPHIPSVYTLCFTSYTLFSYDFPRFRWMDGCFISRTWVLCIYHYLFSLRLSIPYRLDLLNPHFTYAHYLSSLRIRATPRSPSLFSLLVQFLWQAGNNVPANRYASLRPTRPGFGNRYAYSLHSILELERYTVYCGYSPKQSQWGIFYEMLKNRLQI